MAQTAIASHVHHALDVHGGGAPEVALDHIAAIDGLANLDDFGFGQFIDPALTRQADLLAYLARLGGADAENVGKCDFDALVRGYVDAGDTGHG